ncbi:signal peptidase I [Gulosibacter molinativorax]|uniref:signal peptidase I n=1 Tax=Gulosibacter molinativorax TaxID=256821 RepID=UPI00042A2BAA|nr:signal peptidase I [Gulosibacter molinativorax]QUY60742.1 Signal peptidase I [Gulosibacter molinativorax]
MPVPEIPDDDELIPDVIRHSHGPRHRVRVGTGVDDNGNVVHRNTVGLFLRDLLVIAALALVISMVVKTFLLRPFYIPSASMHDTLVEEDRVLVNLLVPKLFELHRGDIVVFEDPGGWMPVTTPPPKDPITAVGDGILEAVGLKPEDSTNHLIKRIIGLPGDHIVCCNAYGQLVINDVPVQEPYVVFGDNTAASGIEFDVTVPKDSIWVMGDNRYNSQDSRAHQDLPTGGFVPYSDIVGQAFAINWPANRMQFLDSHPEVFTDVPSRDPNE